MQPQVKIEGWPALFTLDDACRYLSLSPAQFRKLVDNWSVYPVAIDGSDDAAVWRLRDLDLLIKRLPTTRLREEADREVTNGKLDGAVIDQIARAVAVRLAAMGIGHEQAKRQFVTVKEASSQLGLGRSTLSV